MRRTIPLVTVIWITVQKIRWPKTNPSPKGLVPSMSRAALAWATATKRNALHLRSMSGFAGNYLLLAHNGNVSSVP
jgi:hypothetical protein